MLRCILCTPSALGRRAEHIPAVLRVIMPEQESFKIDPVFLSQSTVLANKSRLPIAQMTIKPCPSFEAQFLIMSLVLGRTLKSFLCLWRR